VNFRTQITQRKAAFQNVATDHNFFFGRFTVENQITARIRRMAIGMQTSCTHFLFESDRQ